MKANEIRNLTDEEIKQKLYTLKQELFNLNFELKSGRVERPHVIRQTKRDIARCLTILNERKSNKNTTTTTKETQ